jgi:hypothetical protein
MPWYVQMVKMEDDAMAYLVHRPSAESTGEESMNVRKKQKPYSYNNKIALLCPWLFVQVSWNLAQPIQWIMQNTTSIEKNLEGSI